MSYTIVTSFKLWIFHLAVIIPALVTVGILGFLNFKNPYILFGCILALFAVFFVYSLLIFRTVRRIYVLTKDKLVIKDLWTNSEEVTELFRVRDWRISNPFWMQFFGLSNVKIISSDETDPITTISGMKFAPEFMRIFEIRVKDSKTTSGTTHLDIKQNPFE